MSRYLPILLSTTLLILLLVGCQTEIPAPVEPSVIPFPTVTPGQQIQGLLSTPNAAARDSAVARIATLDALAALTSPTPNALACPEETTAALPDDRPATTRQVISTVLDFLSNGGTALALLSGMRRDWDILGDEGYVRADRDLTGEGEVETIIAFTSPEDDQGVLIIAGCLDGQVVAHYEQTADDPQPPQIIEIIDMNRDQRTDVLLTTIACDDARNICDYNTDLLTWKPDLSRFVSLLNSDLVSDDPPTTRDFDNDEVLEIIIRLTNEGTITTGPLRTGTSIYDWNGTEYVASIIQPDAPRYRIQVVHEGDRYFNQREMTQAVNLYLEALDNEDLDSWLEDEDAVLRSYIYYRLMLALAYLDQDITTVYEAHSAEFPLGTETPYIEMSTAFYDGSFETTDLVVLCNRVERVIQERTDALVYLNRYGNRSPTYTAQELCPF